MRTLIASLFVLVTLGTATQAFATDAATAQKPIKTLINAIRYGKYDVAAKQLATAAMVQRLLGADASKFNAAELSELAQGVETLIRARGFVKGKEMFQYLDNVIYGDVRDQGSDVVLKSTIVINRELKKTEMVIIWTLTMEAGALKLVDTTMAGESTATVIREEDVEPLMKEGGAAAVMKAMRSQVAKANKK